MPSLGLAHPRGRFPFERLTAAALVRIARFPSYRAPRAADLHDPNTFPPRTEPSSEPVMSGRAFIAFGTTRRDVRLVAVQPFVGELAASPFLTRLRRLDLTGSRIGAEGARALAASPYLRGLRELALNGNALGDDGAAALVPLMAALERLEIADNGLGADAVGRLLDAAPQLTAVDVSGNAADVAALLRRGLREVAARTTRRAEGRQAPGASPHRIAPDVVEGGGHPGPDGPRLARLNRLDLRHTPFPLRGPFPALAHLDLGFTAADFDPAAFPALRSLGLRGCRLTHPQLPATVEELDLSVNPLADPAAVLRACPNLVRLDLANTGLTDATVAPVIAAASSSRLRHLSLAWNPLRAAVVAELVEKHGLSDRLTVDLTGTRGRLPTRLRSTPPR